MDLETSGYGAVIFDLDGVITRTAALHARAWKQMFDALLEQREREDGTPQPPFDMVHDYRTYVDGKSRLEGLQAFLEARRIDLPWGESSDRAGAETVNGLGRLKNQILRDLIDREGVDVFPGSVVVAAQARLADLKTAVVTSSKNGPLIMDRSGLMDLFDALVDGNVAEQMSLRGKPQPDIMMESTRRLGVRSEEAILFEDAVAGVQAGRAAGMKLVIGVARDGNQQQLEDAGAHLVVGDLSELRFLATKPRSTASLLHAGEAIPIVRALTASVPRTAVFLDYDGTLTPIVSRPELATLDDTVRHTLSRLAEHCTVTVISGRSMDDVRSLVGLEGLFYAGSHGFEIAGPDGAHSPLKHIEDVAAAVRQVAEALHERLDHIEGVLIEEKPLSVAVHFRLAPADAEPEVSEAIEVIVSRYSELRRSEGKKVIEIRPDIDWDKGRAVDFLLEHLGIDAATALVVYVGDDLTDEDALRALQGRGIGVVVRDSVPRDTYADLALEDPQEVHDFLETLVRVTGRIDRREAPRGGGS